MAAATRTSAAEPLPACAPVSKEAPAPSAVFEPEEPPEQAPAETHDPSDGHEQLGPRDSWNPVDQSWSPFDGDDDDEVQA